MASATCLALVSCHHQSRGRPLKTDEGPCEHFCGALWMAALLPQQQCRCSASVSAEGMATKQPGTLGQAVPGLIQAGLSSHHCRAD